MLDERAVTCPYCGEAIDLLVDASVGEQSYIEDCSVCCQPMRVTVVIDATGDVSDVLADREE